MASAVLFFEDIHQVVREFQEVHLNPQLAGFAYLSKWVSYRTSKPIIRTRPEAEVVADAQAWLGQQDELGKVLIFLDLCPDINAATPDRSYGVKVLHGLSGKPLGQLPEPYLSNQNRLVVTFSTHLLSESGMTALFRDVWGNDANTIGQLRLDRAVGDPVERALQSVRQEGPRVLLADRAAHGAWAARVAARWLKNL